MQWFNMTGFESGDNTIFSLAVNSSLYVAVFRNEAA